MDEVPDREGIKECHKGLKTELVNSAFKPLLAKDSFICSQLAGERTAGVGG